MLGETVTLGNAISWIAIVGGWGVVHHLSLKRERRKENREVADLAVKKIDEIVSEAIGFQCAKKYDENVFHGILIKMGRLCKKLKKEPLCRLKINDRCIIEFRQSVTLYNVEPSGFVQQNHTSEIVKRIREEADSLIDAIEEGKSKYFQ